MKRFVVKIFICAFAAYLIALGLDFMISRGLSSFGGHPHQAWSEICSRNFPSDIIIMGTSRALQHYDPYIIDSITGMQSYNLGMGGYSINIELMKYRYYTHYHPAPRYIIYDVDQIILTIDTAAHHHESEQFLPLFYDNAIRDDLKKVGYSWIDMYIPMARYWGYQTQNKRGLFEILNIKHYCDYPSYRGHIPDPVTEWDPRRLHFTDSTSLQVDKEAQKMFENFVKECRENDIKLIFVTSPVYYSVVEMSQTWNQYINYFDSIAQANGIPYLNYMENSICCDSTLFNSGAHLTHEGTKIFSTMLAEDLVNNLIMKGEKK